MKRTIKFNLIGNINKLKKLADLRQEYFEFVNYLIKKMAKDRVYILSDKEVQVLNSRLSYSFKQCAYRQAEKIWKS